MAGRINYGGGFSGPAKKPKLKYNKSSRSSYVSALQNQGGRSASDAQKMADIKFNTGPKKAATDFSRTEIGTAGPIAKASPTGQRTTTNVSPGPGTKSPSTTPAGFTGGIGAQGGNTPQGAFSGNTPQGAFTGGIANNQPGGGSSPQGAFTSGIATNQPGAQNTGQSAVQDGFDMVGYSDQLKAQGRSDLDVQEMMYRKMLSQGMNPNQVDAQFGWPTGTTQAWIQKRNQDSNRTTGFVGGTPTYTSGGPTGYTPDGNTLPPATPPGAGGAGGGPGAGQGGAGGALSGGGAGPVEFFGGGNSGGSTVASEFMKNSYLNPVQRNIQANDTVLGQLANLERADSDYMQQVQQRAMEQSKASGLMNSSLAVDSARAAAVREGLPIAQQDASAYLKQGLTNQEAQNAALTQQRTAALEDTLAHHASGLRRGEAQLGADLDISKMEAEYGMKVEQWGRENNATRQQELAKQISGLQAQYTQAVGEINKADMGVKDKEKQIEALKESHLASMKATAQAYNVPPEEYVNWLDNNRSATDTAVNHVLQSVGIPQNGYPVTFRDGTTHHYLPGETLPRGWEWDTNPDTGRTEPMKTYFRPGTPQ